MGSGLGLGLGSGCEGCANVTAEVVGESGGEEGGGGACCLPWVGQASGTTPGRAGGRWRDEISDFTLLGKLRHVRCGTAQHVLHG